MRGRSRARSTQAPNAATATLTVTRLMASRSNRILAPIPITIYYHAARNAIAAAASEGDEFRRKQHVVTAMVFSALCLEAFVNQQHSWPSKPRTSLRDKWLQLPHLLGGSQTFDPKAEPFATFSHLVDTRNGRLVHFQPNGETHYTDTPPDRRYFGDLVGDVALAERYLRCVEAMITTLHRLTEGRTEIPGFLSGHEYLSDVSASCTVAYESLGPKMDPPPEADDGAPTSMRDV